MFLGSDAMFWGVDNSVECVNNDDFQFVIHLNWKILFVV